MRSKEVYDLLLSHMLAIIGRSRSRAANFESASKFYVIIISGRLHVHEFIMASLNIALLQANTHGQDLSVWHLRSLGPLL
jgi:hypothetical protein